ncbi:MAG: TDT family transporter [Actinomycetota bacterium]
MSSAATPVQPGPDPREAATPAGTPEPGPVARGLARAGLLRDLDRPQQVFAYLGPNWFAAVMGTGVVAVAADSLPYRMPGLRGVADMFWVLAAVLLAALLTGTAVHWGRHPATARGHIRHPVLAYYYGAPPMALVTVGTGALLAGRDLIGLRVAVDTDWVLWLAGAAMGLLTAVAASYLTLTRPEARDRVPFGGWLMPVVPPMVSASAGALLVPYAAPGVTRLVLLACCYAMFGLSLVASAFVISRIVRQVVAGGAGEPRMIPTLWIVLGPLGQSVTAANLLGSQARLVLPGTRADVLRVAGLVYGLPVGGFALLWAGAAAAITIATARRHLPFSLTWWSFTFPVGTCVTGAAELALHTGLVPLRVLAMVFFAALAVAWLTVASRTARDGLRGRLFLPADRPDANPAS